MTKRLLCPPRLRHVPRQFSWIDQRLLREGYFERAGGAGALALYLLLVSAADAQGLSYYSERTTARLLALPESEVRAARRALQSAGLIAYEAPLYQVLSLEPTPVSPALVSMPVPVRAARPAVPPEVVPIAPRSGEPLHLSEILRALFAARESGAPNEPGGPKSGGAPR